MENLVYDILDGISNEFIDKAKNIPIEAINLPVRAKNAVEAAGAQNSLDAVKIIVRGFSGAIGVGAKTILESQTKVYSFIQKVETSSAEELKQFIDPREVHFASLNGNLIDAFPGILELYLNKKSRANFNRNQDIMNKRFALNGEKQYTLEDIGTYYDLTRERIRQVEAKTIKEIGLLLIAKLETKTWKIDELLQLKYLTFREKLNVFNGLILKHEVDAILFDSYGCSFKSGYLDLFMEVSGYTKLPNSFEGFRGTIRTCWCLASNYQKKEVESIFQSLDGIFDSAGSVPLFDLIISSKKKAKKKISNESLHVALKSCNEIEVVNDSVLVKFSNLRSAGDKAFRILDTSNKTMHYSEIAKEINLLDKDSNNFRAVKDTNLKNQLVADSRFTAVGRSGNWGLSVWDHLNSVTIVEAIESILHKSGKPLSFKEISIEIHKIRPDASERSLRVYLSGESDKLMRVGNDLFALSAWKMSPYQSLRNSPKVSNETFYRNAKEILLESNPIPLPVFLKKIRDRTGLSEPSIRQRVNNSDYFKTKSSDKGYSFVYCNDDFFNIDEASLNKKLLKDKVQDEIRAILYEKPNIPVRKGDLYNSVKKVVPCKIATFYRYLEESTGIRQYKKNNNYFAIYDHHEDKKKIEIDLSSYVIDNATKDKLKRPISMLDINDIDIALFEFGLIFENELKEYLLDAKKASKISVTQKDLSKLSTMIDCVIRENVVTKGHHLNTLREERNNRAHGTPPTVEERQVIFDKAHYVANLFVKYIAFFNAKKAELKNLAIASS